MYRLIFANLALFAMVERKKLLKFTIIHTNLCVLPLPYSRKWHMDLGT